MDEKLYIRLKAELDLKHQASDAEYQISLKSLDRVWAMANGKSTPPMSIKNHADAENIIRGFWRKVAQLVIDEMPSGNQFTVRKVQEAIAEKQPDIKTDAVGTLVFLKHLVREGEIEVVRQGRGKNPTVFKKPGDQLGFSLVS